MGKNIQISDQTHAILAQHVQSKGLLLGKYADKVIKENIVKEGSKAKKSNPN